MFRSLLNLLLGCTHQRTTFPLTPRRNAAPGATRNTTYVVCLDCGKEFNYNWREMRVGQAIAPRPLGEVEPAHGPAYWRQPTRQRPREGTHTV